MFLGLKHRAWLDFTSLSEETGALLSTPSE